MLAYQEDQGHRPQERKVGSARPLTASVRNARLLALGLFFAPLVGLGAVALLALVDLWVFGSISSVMSGNPMIGMLLWFGGHSTLYFLSWCFSWIASVVIATSYGSNRSDTTECDSDTEVGHLHVVK